MIVCVGAISEEKRKEKSLELERRYADLGIRLELCQNHWASNWFLYQNFKAQVQKKYLGQSPATAEATPSTPKSDDAMDTKVG